MIGEGLTEPSNEAQRIEMFKMIAMGARDQDRKPVESITVKDIQKGLSNKFIESYFHHLGVDVMGPEMMANYFDVDNDSSIGRSEFIRGCERLQGAAKPSEVQRILDNTSFIKHKLVE